MHVIALHGIQDKVWWSDPSNVSRDKVWWSDPSNVSRDKVWWSDPSNVSRDKVWWSDPSNVSRDTTGPMHLVGLYCQFLQGWTEELGQPGAF